MSTPGNLGAIYKHLTSDEVVKASGGRIKAPFSPEQAAALMGNWIVETGRPNLDRLDVVEKGNNGAGRGLSQYTGVRRTAYDTARQDHIKNGGDPNQVGWQLKYFWEEYTGKHDMNGASLIGWTKAFEQLGKGRPEDLAVQLRKSYFRPSTPHDDRRSAEARRVYNLMNGGKTPTPPKPQESSARPAWMDQLNIPRLNQR